MSKLDFLSARNFFHNLKEHVRHKVEEYVDQRIEEVKSETVIRIMNKMLNDMVDDKPLNKPEKDKPKKIRQVNIEYDQKQNKKVINALFVGKILEWKRSHSGKKYEVRVEKGGIFVDPKTGKKIAESPSTACKVLAGGGSYNGWDHLTVRLDHEEKLQTIGYYRAKFFSNK